MLRITLWLLVGVCGFASCNNICPDGNVLSDLSTCCMTTDGYRACPYPNAVCCSDLEHCCPSGFQCNLGTQMCEKVNQPWMNIPMVKKEAAEKPSTLLIPVSPLQELKNNLDQKKSSVVNCDNNHNCRGGETCCRSIYGTWFCCPYSSAMCCADRRNCCPYGTFCARDGKCVRRGLRYPFSPIQALSSVPASLISTSEDKDNLQEDLKNNLDQKQRPDHLCEHGIKCRVGQTCCRGKGNRPYFCCRHRSATCCADRKNCCPYGTICDYDGTCVRRSLRYPFSPEQALSSVPASLISTSEDKDNLQEDLKNNLDQKQRPDHLCEHGIKCHVGQTCCRGKGNNAYFCCRHRSATCCADRKNCCPYGTICDYDGTCVRRGLRYPFSPIQALSSVPASLISTSEDKDNLQEEPKNNLDQKQRSDHLCEHGYKCLVGETCCRGKGNRPYFCCPLRSATCCADRRNCCPYGTICARDGKCVRRGLRYPFSPIQALSSVPASLISTSEDKDNLQEEPKNNLDQKQRSDHLCENGHTCPVGQTCCRGIGNNAYFCCPHHAAMCCADRRNCCPYGTFCARDGKCMRRGLRYPFTPEQALSSVPASLVSTSEDKDNLQEELKNNLDQKQRSDHLCENGHTCPVGQTCCRGIGNNAYFCCPHHAAMCCADRRNCCPYGTFCARDGKNMRRGLRYPFTPKQALSSVPASLISTSEDKDNLQEDQ
ncbi:progranulin-like isoform X2 [Thunnus maccoyii]|uniref:progranulin-like isoform X2 n=1 Tax=Thunnus maccoyii TaxID=8240 RepID=UPI001C4D53FD|nr:progranulin-like isoform X2 [Thunnus maccoyii]